MKVQWARTAVVVVFLLAACTTVLSQMPVAAGYRDFGFGPLVAPTGEKPESKLWWNDGSWWGVLWNAQLGAHHIYKFDWPNQSWIDTGTPADDRSNTKVDVKWDGASNKLYVASHIYTTSASATTDPNTWGRLYRYTYSTGTYSQDSGFPVTITKGQSEALVIDKDTTGMLWVTFVQSSKVYINHSTTGDNVWGTPFLIPASLAARQTSSDDISSVIAFGPGKIGVMWSNQVGKKFFFAVHNDGDPDTVWAPEQTALPGPGGIENSDDHINLKSVQSDASGRVFAAIKTSLNDSNAGPNAPLIELLVRDSSGNWSHYIYGQVKDNHTRPIVLLDTEHNEIYMFAASPDSGTPESIYYKTSDMTNISFPVGKGAPFIQSVTDVGINNGTSTKQNVNSTTGLLVLASDPSAGCNCAGSHVYLHNTLTLNGATAPTISSFSPTKGGVGTVVTVSGSNLSAVNIAAVNGMVGTNLSIISDAQLQMTVPVGASNGVISVTDPNGGVALSSGSFTVQAGTISTTTTLVSSANPSAPGQQVTFTATVNHSSGAAVPTGTISFLDGGTTLGVSVLDSTGAATLATSALTQGTHSITARYSGDGKYHTSTSSALSQVVNAALVSTTTAVASSANPSTVGQSVTFTATVTPTSGTTVPTGTVTFLDGATTLGTGALDGTGKATLATSALTQGTHSITASYGGSSSFSASTSSALSQVVNAVLVSTTTAVASSANPSTVGQSVTFTATVTPTSGTTVPTGTVTFLDGATTLGTGALDGTGKATLATSALTQGTHSITASYGGSSSFSASTSSALSQVVNAVLVSTTTAVASSANPSTVGQSVTFTATVTPTSGTTVPTGTVTFLDGATTLGTGALDGTGKATLATSALTQGTHSITASYGGSSSFSASTSSALSQVVNAALVSTTTAVASSANPSTVGQSVTFTATVTPTSGTTVPTGTVTFLDGATTLGTGALDGTGKATLATSALTQGTHSITASYGGSSSFSASTSSALSQVVNAALVSTTTAVASSANPSTVGQSVTFTATVTPTSGTTVPTGTVTFLDGATTLGTGALDGTGKATLATSALTQGTHSITASYGGSSSFSASTSSALSQVVNAALVSTTTAVASSANPSTVGQSVTFTATVTPTSGTTVPTGTVTFLDGATTLGTGALDGTGKATLATSALTQGTHSITASYGGSSSFSASTSSALSQVVNAVLVSTTTAVASSANPSTVGQSVTFTATVTPTSGTTVPTGTVTFLDGATTLGTGALDGTGKATLATSALTQGTHSITASYGGSSSFGASTSSALSQGVNGISLAATTTTLGSSANPSAVGQSVTFTVTVTPTSGTGTPTGTVSFLDGTTALGTGALDNTGTTTLATSVLTQGTHSITATYGGDGSFAPSTSSALSQVVNAVLVSTTTAVASSANPSGVGQLVTFTATVTPASGTTVPTGMVTFLDGTTTLGTGALDITGKTTFATSGLTQATHSITASYAGDGNFAASTSSALSQVVNAAVVPTLVSVTPSSGSGASQTFQYVFSDANGATAIKSVRTLIGVGTANAGSCQFMYDLGSNTLSVMKDNGSGWGSSQQVGVSGSISNSQCSVDTGISSASLSGSNLTLNLATTFTASFAGSKTIYMLALDVTGLSTGFKSKGTWTTANIIATAPSPVSVTPSSGSGTSQAFQYVFSDVNGGWYVKSLRVLINATTSNVSACEFYYTVSNNSLQAMKDDGSTWGTSVILGQAGSVSNSQCSVDTAASNAVTSGNNITLNLAVTFSPGFTGAKNNYMQAYDNGGLTSGFVLKGTWTTGP